MKLHLFFSFLLALLLVLAPLVSLYDQANASAYGQSSHAPDRAQASAYGQSNTQTSSTTLSTTLPKTTAASQAVPPAKKSYALQTIPVVRQTSGKLAQIAAEDYIVGCLAAEVPPTMHIEALKAQAVAAYTYACYKLQVMQHDALTDTGNSDQGYLSREQRQQRWGEHFSRYEAKLRRAASAVAGLRLEYDGKPIFAAYHSVSSGQTEDAKVVWGQSYPYLLRVQSPGDLLSPDCKRTRTLADAAMRERLVAAGASPGKDASLWFGKATRSEAGSVVAMEVCGSTWSGAKLRKALELRSTHVQIAHKNGTFTLTTLGYGHGVGMSQYGADFLARQGKPFAAILATYYSGVTLV